jgi:hypothetical protein
MEPSVPPTNRWPLPLHADATLDLASDFVFVTLVPVSTGEEPFLELVGPHRQPLRHDSPDVVVRVEGSTTYVRVDGVSSLFDDHDRHRHVRPVPRWWEGAFWDKRRLHRKFRVQLIAHVPADVRARIHSAAARVVAERLSGCALSIEVDAGAVSLEDISGRLALRTQAGRVDGRGLRGSLDVTTSAGALRLEILSLDPGVHRVRTHMGAAYLEIARGMPVQIDTRTAMGSSRVEVKSTRGAPAVLDVEADLGAIRVGPSPSTWREPPPRSEPASIYRTNQASETEDAEIDAILAKVADGSLPVTDARELLRAMGWS